MGKKSKMRMPDEYTSMKPFRNDRFGHSDRSLCLSGELTAHETGAKTNWYKLEDDSK